jgi:hypothetical protein
MRIAYIITAHQYPAQLARLVRRPDAAESLFIIHVNRRTAAATSTSWSSGRA